MLLLRPFQTGQPQRDPEKQDRAACGLETAGRGGAGRRVHRAAGSRRHSAKDVSAHDPALQGQAAAPHQEGAATGGTAAPSDILRGGRGFGFKKTKKVNLNERSNVSTRHVFSSRYPTWRKFWVSCTRRICRSLLRPMRSLWISHQVGTNWLHQEPALFCFSFFDGEFSFEHCQI